MLQLTNHVLWFELLVLILVLQLINHVLWFDLLVLILVLQLTNRSSATVSNKRTTSLLFVLYFLLYALCPLLYALCPLLSAFNYLSSLQ